MTSQYVALYCRGVASAKSEADAGIRFTFSDSFASEKQLLIFMFSLILKLRNSRTLEVHNITDGMTENCCTLAWDLWPEG